MRLNWIMNNANNYVTMDDVMGACYEFHRRHKAHPETIKMSYQDMTTFFTFNGGLGGVKTLEKNKEYGNFISIPGGMVELLVLEDSAEENAYAIQNSGVNYPPLPPGVTHHATRVLVLESNKLEREFEKHVLNKED